MTSLFKKLFHRHEVSVTPPLLVVGLGNPGKKYARTRHNFGFLAVDSLWQTWGGTDWHLEKKFQTELSEVTRNGRRIYLAKPQTFMNDSGKSVRTLLDFYKLSPQELVVLHDEVDIPFGKIKLTLSSRAAGHNGVKDIIEKLGTQDFCRLRLGVGKSENPNISTADHVLQNFSPEEAKNLPTLFEELIATLELNILSRK